MKIKFRTKNNRKIMLQSQNFIFALSLVALLSARANGQQTCSNLGDLNVFLDPSCSTTGGPGCNAGGQGQNCRFCG